MNLEVCNLSFFNYLDDLFFILDLNGSIIEINKSVETKLGFLRDDIKNKNIIDILHYPEIKENLFLDNFSLKNLPFLTKNGIELLLDIKCMRVKIKCAGDDFILILAKDMYNEEKYKMELNRQSLIADISQKLNSSSNLNEHIQEILKLLGEHLYVSRVYIFEDSNDNETTSNTYEWCNVNIDSQIQNLQDIQLIDISSWYKILNRDGKILSNNIKELPDDIYPILESQQIKSILVYPFSNNKKKFGFIGFDDCLIHRVWRKDDLDLLKIISNIISNTLNRFKVEKELRNSKDFAENLMNTANVMIVGLDINGNVGIFNKSAEKLTGYKEIEILGKNWFTELTILPKDELKKVNDAFKLLTLDDEADNIFENSIITKHGEIKYILWQNNEIKKNNEIIGTISFGLDITDRKIFEAELIKSKEKAEESDKLKLEFLANMSHDLRTPMNAIIGFSDLLKSNNLNKIERVDYINTIIENGKFLMSLIDDIIDISKIDAKALKIIKNDFELNKLLDEIRMTFIKQIKDKKLDIILDIDINKNIIINSDKNRLRQILINLISNAVKFTKEGYIKFGYNIINEELLMLYVEDTGVGIEKNNQKIIFNKFKQINENKNKFKGAGLGLTITKSLIELLGFKEIKLQSQLGKGSKFYFNVPYTIKHFNYINEIKNKYKNKKLNLNSKKILIVEDDRDSVVIMKSHLLLTKAQIFECNDGNDEILNIIKKEHINLVLLDIGLPGKNGYEILKEIRNYDERLPVIIESAVAMPDQKSKAYQLGCSDFLSKPFSREDFLNKIDNWI